MPVLVRRVVRGRVDLARYGNSLALCRNFKVSPYGGVRNRAGFRFTSAVKDHAKRVRLVPFTFNTSQAYAVELGDGYLRVFQDGVAVTVSGAAAWVTATNYALGDHKTNNGTTYYCRFAHTSGTFATDLASGYWHALTGNTVEVPTPYVEAELRAIRYVQSADVMTLVHPNHPPMQLNRYGADDWRLVAQALDSGPFQGINTDKEIVRRSVRFLDAALPDVLKELEHLLLADAASRTLLKTYRHIVHDLNHCRVIFAVRVDGCRYRRCD